MRARTTSLLLQLPYDSLKCVKNKLYTPPTPRIKSCTTVCWTTGQHLQFEHDMELLFLEEEAQWSYSSKFSPAMFVYSMWPSPEARFAQRVAGFLRQESYFWLTWVGSDVTSVSSSSGLGSSLAPEILRSFPVVLGEVEEVWSQQTWRGG